MDAGAFRVPRPRDTWERIDAPKFAGDVHDVDRFKGANVEDTEGKSYPVKPVLAVPAGSQDVDLGIETGPGGGRRARQREMLQDYATNLKRMLPSTGYTLARELHYVLPCGAAVLSMWTLCGPCAYLVRCYLVSKVVFRDSIFLKDLVRLRYHARPQVDQEEEFPRLQPNIF